MVWECGAEHKWPQFGPLVSFFTTGTHVTILFSVMLQREGTLGTGGSGSTKSAGYFHGWSKARGPDYSLDTRSFKIKKAAGILGWRAKGEWNLPSILGRPCGSLTQSLESLPNTCPRESVILLQDLTLCIKIRRTPLEKNNSNLSDRVWEGSSHNSIDRILWMHSTSCYCSCFRIIVDIDGLHYIFPCLTSFRGKYSH